MTTSELDTLNKMIDAYTETGKYTSVSDLLPEIKDNLVLEFLEIIPKYQEVEKILNKLKYIRDNVVEKDCPTCIANEEKHTTKENKTMSDLKDGKI